VVAGVKAGQGTVGRLLTDDTIAVRIENLVTALDEGPVGELIRDETVGDDVRRVVANLRTMSDMMAKGDGTLGKLIHDPTLYEKAVVVLGNIESATAALSADSGVLGALADEQTGENLKATIARAESLARNLDELVQGVRQGEGTLGLLVADQEMRQKVELALTRLDDFIEEQRENTTFLTFAVLLLGAF
jgi:phospholipid/cholesterol/gamma-HCH transport system substrate-binding protein